MIRFILIC